MSSTALPEFFTISEPGATFGQASFWDYFVDNKIQNALKEKILPRMSADCQRVTAVNNQLFMANPHGVHYPGHLLWLHRAALPPGFIGEHIVLYLGKTAHVWTRAKWDLNQSIPSQFSRGILFEYQPAAAHPGAGTPAFALIQGQGPAGGIAGFLNPLVIKFDCAEQWDQARPWLWPLLSDGCLLDVLPNFSGVGRLRGELHRRYTHQLPCDPNAWSYIDRLLAADPAAWDRSETPFLLLDYLGGVFLIDAPGSHADASRAWFAPADYQPNWQVEWLVAWCLRKLGLIFESGPRLPAVLPRHPFYDQRRNFRRHQPAGLRRDGEQRWRNVFQQSIEPVRNGIEDSEVSRDWQLAEAQNEIADGRDFIGFIEAICQRLLRPISRILARLPEPPDGLPLEQQAQWAVHLGNQAIEVIETNLSGELCWLMLLTGEAKTGQPDGPWPVADNGWTKPYYQALFCRPPLVRENISWLAGNPSVIGQALLGELMLGGAGLARMSEDDPLIDWIFA